MLTMEQSVEFRHLPDFRLYICIPCGYCVLPQTLDRHLKRIHGLPHVEREHHVSKAQELDLAASNDVLYPEAGGPMIPGLPTFGGYTCVAPRCQYMCVTLKRMQAHWSAIHHHTGPVDEIERYCCRPATLQTFFRGAGLRYFEVASSSDETPKDTATMTGSGVSLSRNLPTVNNETMTEWLLRKQFHDHDYMHVLPIKSTEQSWRDDILQIGSTTDYLRHLVLSVMASRVASENPHSRQLFESQAIKHRALAIRTLPVDSLMLVPGRFFAMFNFSLLMTVSYLATAELSEQEGDSYYFEPGTVIPVWIDVQRQGLALVWPHKNEKGVADAMRAPARCLIAASSDSHLNWNPEDGRMKALDTRLRMLKNARVDVACLEALGFLRVLWAIPYQAESFSLRDMALTWTARLSQEYVDMLKKRDPVALVIFAHWCTLWSYSEAIVWYMRGHARMILFRIVQSLPWEWQDWISWPIKVVMT